MSPLYAYKCECGNEFDEYFPLSMSDAHPLCQRCGTRDNWKDFSKLSICIDRTLGYYDHQLGEYIGSSADHRRIMKQKGVEAITSDGESDRVKAHIQKNRKTKEQKYDEYKKIIKESAYKHNIPLKGVS